MSPSSLLCSLSIHYTHPALSYISTLSRHDALPIYAVQVRRQRSAGAEHTVDPEELAGAAGWRWRAWHCRDRARQRSEEHTSELKSLTNLVCRLLLEKKKKQ